MGDEYEYANSWRPDPSRTPHEWLREGLQREDDCGPYRFVRIHGQDYVPVPRPANVWAGKPRCCFANAFQLATSRPELRYVEGFGTLWGSDTWLHRHAWCVDEKDRVVDPTWCAGPELPLAFRGVVLPLDLVQPYCFDESRGALDYGLRDRLGVVALRIGVPWPA